MGFPNISRPGETFKTLYDFRNYEVDFQQGIQTPVGGKQKMLNVATLVDHLFKKYYRTNEGHGRLCPL